VPSQVLQTLTQGGFLVGVDVLDARELDPPVKGSVILFAPGEETKAEIVARYVPGLRMEAAPRSVLGDADVAVVLGPNFVPQPLEEQPAQTSADCPT